MASNSLTYHALLGSGPDLPPGSKDWRPWIQKCGRSQDRKTRQYASRALFNLDAFDQARATEALVGGGRVTPHILHQGIHSLQTHPSCLPPSGDQAERKTREMAKVLFKQMTGIDMVAPNRSIEEAGNTSNSAATMSAPPVMDVVFVHGLRGGAFSTWRLSPPPGGKEDFNTCWPADFLAPDMPDARLLSVSYKTRFTDWGGYTLSLQDLSLHVLARLRAAGVGSRPVVFVTHSLGGLVVKQMLADAAVDPKYSKISDRTKGIIFFSTPHFGSWLAPTRFNSSLIRAAPTIDQMRHSPHLDDLNAKLRSRHQKGSIQVLSFAEGINMSLVEVNRSRGIAWRADVVPMESAYPGFGEFVVLEQTDHVNICKPVTKEDLAYSKTLQFLRNIYDRVAMNGCA
eukprot:CAMPEP_0114241166 /NCGR_PEP_ID=MMETSP0058-20121206/9491_1 /TAXON_ID=36894 /ORGANISM="Pyramimonas parkeae, CCMP726" /LENGTH=398 /DNA_ID=CAMNT_0001353681 /DNA_START=10 /DNA_END=1206 /DNA_ORIENTATION=+